jgi:hypothetical protein
VASLQALWSTPTGGCQRRLARRDTLRINRCSQTESASSAAASPAPARSARGGRYRSGSRPAGVHVCAVVRLELAGPADCRPEGGGDEVIVDRHGGPLVVAGWGQCECCGDEYAAEALATVWLVDTHLLEHRAPAWPAHREIEVGEGDAINAQLQLTAAAGRRREIPASSDRLPSQPRSSSCCGRPRPLPPRNAACRNLSAGTEGTYRDGYRDASWRAFVSPRHGWPVGGGSCR